MPKVLVATVALMITRDAMTVLPTTVPGHEVEIQKAVFGEDNVEVLEKQDDAAPVEIDSEGEVTRLEGKYGNGALEGAYGVNYKGAIARALKEHILSAAVAAGEGSATAAKPLETMTKAELLAEAEKRGVTVDATMNKAQIVEAIETAHLG